MLRQCDWCGDDIQTTHPNSDPYVINAEHKIFCKIHTPGKEPFKDCLEDYEKKTMYKKKSKKERAPTHTKNQRSREEKVIKKLMLFS